MNILNRTVIKKSSKFIKTKRLNRSVFLIFLVSYISVLVLSMMINIFYHNRIEKKMFEQTKRSNLAMLEQLKIDLDNKITQVNELSNNIVFNTKVNLLLKGNDTVYSYYDLKKELMAFPKSEFIYDYYIYFASTDEILTATLKSKSKEFYDMIYNFEDMSYETWHQDFLNQYHFQVYLPTRQLNAYGSLQQQILTFVQTIPISSNQKLLGQTVILIDESKFTNIIDKLSWGTNAHIYALDKQGNVILSSNGATPLSDKVKKKLTTSVGIFNDIENKEKATVLYHVSQDTQWKYVMVIPNSTFLYDIQQTKTLAFTLLAFLGVLGSLLAYVYSYRNYRPIKEIQDLFAKKGAHSNLHYRNEFEYIKNSITDALERQDHLHNMMNTQLPVMRSDYLSKLLKGYLGGIDIDKEALDFMKIHLLSDQFIVIVGQISRQSPFLTDLSEKEWALSRFVLTNVTNELIPKNYERYFIELERNQIAFILNTPDQTTPEVAQNKIKALIPLFDNTLGQQCGLYVTFGVSTIYTGMVQLRQCYDEAMKALEYGILNNEQSFTFFANINTQEQYYYYPLDIEVQLINMIRAANYEDAVQTIHMLFEVNFISKQVTPETGRYFIIDLSSTLLKVLNTVLAKNKESLVSIEDLIDQIFIYDGIDKIQSEIEKIIFDICELIQESYHPTNDQLIQNIMIYITENISEHSLSLTSIAETFNMTPQYISTLFKTHTDENIKDFVSKARVEKAKELLANEQLTLTDIANQLGYANDMGIIRLFKRYEGVTPGVYRKQLKS